MYRRKKQEHNMVLLLTFPANGILNGSVQKMLRHTNAIKDVLTVIDNSIGSSGVITEVRINEQHKKSLYRLFVGSSSPYTRINKHLIGTRKYIIA